MTEGFVERCRVGVDRLRSTQAMIADHGLHSMIEETIVKVQGAAGKELRPHLKRLGVRLTGDKL